MTASGEEQGETRGPMMSMFRSPGMPVTIGRAVAQLRHAGRTGAMIAATGIALLLSLQPAAAQDADLRSLAQQVERLQSELSELQRTVYNGAPPPAGSVATGDGSNLDASQEIRLQQIQDQVTGLTGQVEELNFRMTRVEERIDSLAAAVGSIMHGGAQPPADAAGVPMADGGAGTATGAAPAASPPATGSTAPGTLGTMTQGQMDAAQAGTAAPADAGAAATVPQTAAVPTGPYDLPGNTPDEQYQFAFGLLRQANYPEAERALRTFIERNPTSPLAGNAQYWLGETYYVRGDYRNAAVAFAEGYQKYPDSGKAPDNLLKLGMSLGEIGSKGDACTALSQLDKQFPGAPANIKERATGERQRLGC